VQTPPTLLPILKKKKNTITPRKRKKKKEILLLIIITAHTTLSLSLSTFLFCCATETQRARDLGG
jgi:flagellar basal body-associated protein FliL